MYREYHQGYDVSEQFYELYKACRDHCLDVLYATTIMQVQQAHYPETYKDQGYLWYYIRKDDFSDPKQNVLDLVRAGGPDYIRRLFYFHNERSPPCHPGNATITSIFKRGPKCTRTSSCRVSFHLKTPESIEPKSAQSSITSVKKQGTHSISNPSAKNPRKSSTSTICSKSTSQNSGPEPRSPDHTNQVPIAPPTLELPTEQQTACSSTMKLSPLTPNCRPLPCLTPLTESELQGLCASILHETFPEVCITDTVIPDPREHTELDPTALQWRDPNSKTFSHSSQLVPISLATMHQFSGVSSPTPLVVLFDCGSQLSFLKHSKVPKDHIISTIEQPVCGLTSTSHLTEEVTLTGIMLPEFSASKRIDSTLCCLLLDEQQEDSTYDMILGLDFLCAVGIDILCSKKQLRWDDATLAFQPHDTYKETHTNLHAHTIEVFAYGDEDDDPEGLGYKSTQIMEAKYEAIDTDELAHLQKQLTPKQRTDLAHLFHKFPKLFDGELHMYPHRQYHLDLQDGTKPVHSSIWGTVHATGRVQMRAQSSCQDWHLGMLWCFSMGIWYFHHSQEGWPCLMDIRLLCSQQMHQEENLPVTSHF